MWVIFPTLGPDLVDSVSGRLKGEYSWILDEKIENKRIKQKNKRKKTKTKGYLGAESARSPASCATRDKRHRSDGREGAGTMATPRVCKKIRRQPCFKTAAAVCSIRMQSVHRQSDVVPHEEVPQNRV